VVNSGLLGLMSPILNVANDVYLWLFGMWGKIGINCFVLITGYFMCTSQFTWKKFIKLVCEIEFYKILIYIAFLFFGRESISITRIFQVLSPITNLTTDFVSGFLVMFLLVPFLNLLIHNLSKKQHLYLDEFINRRLSLQDWPVWVILAAYTNFDVLPVSTATFGVETISITRPDTYEKLERGYEGDANVYQYLCELFPDVFPFDKEEWDRYVYGQLMNFAYRKKDYESAKKYAMLCKGKSIKYRCTKTKFLFFLYLWLRKIYNSIE